MKILISGALGRMGSTLRNMVEEGLKGSELAGLVDIRGEGGILNSINDFTGEADCIIDFSDHSFTGILTEYAVRRSIPLVLATTGQNEEEKALISEAAKHIPLFHSANMSLGVAVLAELVKKAAGLFPDAEIEILEIHHDRKLDAPSGTALMLAEAAREARPELKIKCGRYGNARREKDEIGINSIRMGNVTGIHEVYIHTGTQILSLRHEAESRALFAEGALDAASFLIKQGPGLYNMKDIIKEEN